MKRFAIVGFVLFALVPAFAQEKGGHEGMPQAAPAACPAELNGYWISESGIVRSGSYRITIERCAEGRISGRVEFGGLRECRNFNPSFSGTILPDGSYKIRSLPSDDRAACELEMTIGEKDGRYRLDRYTGRITSVYR
jgi:hypothetical protein